MMAQSRQVEHVRSFRVRKECKEYTNAKSNKYYKRILAGSFGTIPADIISNLTNTLLETEFWLHRYQLASGDIDSIASVLNI